MPVKTLPSLERIDRAAYDPILDSGEDRTTLGRNVLPLDRDGLIRIEPIASDRPPKELHLTNTDEKRLQAALFGTAGSTSI